MFYEAAAFNQPIGAWDVSQVTNMLLMFGHAVAFNQPIGTWDVGAVTCMESMFASTEAFNQPIGGWNVGSVTNMDYMFYDTRAFNQPIATWNVSRVTRMCSMFDDAAAFRHLLSAWKVTSSLCDNPFSHTEIYHQIAGVELRFYLSESDPNHLQQWLRVHDMILTLSKLASHARWLHALPEDVVGEVSGWIGMPMVFGVGYLESTV
jgi:surface protein